MTTPTVSAENEIRVTNWKIGPFVIIAINADDPNDPESPMIITSEDEKGFKTIEEAEAAAKGFLPANFDLPRYHYIITIARPATSYRQFLSF